MYLVQCAVLLAVALLSQAGRLVRREIPLGEELDYHGHNSIEEYDHQAIHAVPEHFHLPPPPAYSTITYFQSHDSKPTSYSGFTYHGRGHHDPGYAVEYRSDGFPHSHHHHYY